MVSKAQAEAMSKAQLVDIVARQNSGKKQTIFTRLIPVNSQGVKGQTLLAEVTVVGASLDKRGGHTSPLDLALDGEIGNAITEFTNKFGKGQPFRKTGIATGILWLGKKAGFHGIGPLRNA
jgi:hypothetical protein